VSLKQKFHIPHNWKPREYQLPLWRYMYDGGKRAYTVWHRRSGKDEVGLHRMACAAIRRPATYWYMLPEAAQARKAIWNAIDPHTGKRRIDLSFPPEIRCGINEQEMFLKIKCLENVGGISTLQIVGSDNFNSLVGSPPAGVTFSEYALSNPMAWGYLRPILLENDGWAMFNTTPRGRNHAATLYEAVKDDPTWFCEKLTVDDTAIFTKEQLERELREMIAEHGDAVGKALFRQEYYCSFDSAILGAVYGEWIEKAENQGRITEVEYEPNLPVETAWDLGYDDATSIWFFQRAFGELRLIDFYENSQADIAHYCEMIKSKPYKYKENGHFVPHDAANKLLAAGGRSIVQQAFSLGIKMRVVASTSQMNSISAARKVMEIAWFDEAKCKVGLNALRQYRFDYDEDNKIFKVKPKHDWSSHAADAFEIIGQVYANIVQPQEREKPRFLNEITAEELFFPEKTGINYRERI
jgi:hypothetical protein